jgi:hypothetical protein
LLKLGARVVVSVRRMVLHLPASFPFLPAFRQVAMALGALPGCHAPQPMQAFKEMLVLWTSASVGSF